MGWRGAKRGKERPAGDSVCVYMYTPWKSRQSTKRKIFLAVLAGRRKKLYMIERERERESPFAGCVLLGEEEKVVGNLEDARG